MNRLGTYGLKPAFRRSLEPVARALGGTHPDTVSLGAVIVAAGAGACLLWAPSLPALYLAAPVLFFVRIAANALDGMLAQRQGVGSARGEIVNEMSDRVSDTLILTGLALSGAVDPRLGWGALAATLLASYAGILPKAVGGSRSYAGPLGKADRMALLGLACVAAYVAPRWSDASRSDVWSVAAALVVALGLLTAANRTRLAWRQAGAGR